MTANPDIKLKQEANKAKKQAVKLTQEAKNKAQGKIEEIKSKYK